MLAEKLRNLAGASGRGPEIRAGTDAALPHLDHDEHIRDTVPASQRRAVEKLSEFANIAAPKLVTLCHNKPRFAVIENGVTSNRINQIIAADRIVRNDEVVGSSPTSSTIFWLNVFNGFNRAAFGLYNFCTTDSKPKIPDKEPELTERITPEFRRRRASLAKPQTAPCTIFT